MQYICQQIFILSKIQFYVVPYLGIFSVYILYRSFMFCIQAFLFTSLYYICISLRMENQRNNIEFHYFYIIFMVHWIKINYELD